jgi:hypothetical protein
MMGDGSIAPSPATRQPVNNDGGQGKARNDNRSDLSAAVLFWSTTQGSLFTLVEQFTFGDEDIVFFKLRYQDFNELMQMGEIY